ncbi:MAG: glutamate-5-semialdehyde dehydrogenase [Clostridia bacterium]|nr:glutamate-5-semialdehyde dehydrogenase [Clostridia bacterium]
MSEGSAMAGRTADVRALAQQAREASFALAASSAQARSGALLAAAKELEARREAIFAANALDLEAAREEGLSAPALKRLRFDEGKLADVCRGLRALAAMEDPIGRVQLRTELADGLVLTRVSCPIGVVGVIFESRPDALVQIAGLCLKSGNAVLLKGGREAAHSNAALFDALAAAGEAAGLPRGWAGLLTTREDVGEMLALDREIDLIIPRGSNAFVRYIMDHSRIPVLGHSDGVCHLYLDRGCDTAMAARVVVDAKTQYPAACNAVETLLVHRDEAGRALMVVGKALAEAGVRMLGDERAQAALGCEAATQEDWETEYLDHVISIRVVDSLEEAIAHINRYGSHHTDGIITEDAEAARTFLALVDSAGVYHNCSTRFADGYRYGFGAEVGIATGKLHARGPMGVEGLCSYKYLLEGHGDIVEDFAKERRAFTHRRLV